MPAHPPIPAIGEVQIDPDGVVSGWCYSPARPEERLSVEIMINETLATTVVASRFLEDLRNRGIGDGYYGFSVTLTRQLNRMGHSGIVSARERESQYCFWHWVRGDCSLPTGFDARIAAARARVAALAEFVTTPALPIGPAFAALGRHLALAVRREPHPALTAAPDVSLVAPMEAACVPPPGAELVVFAAAAVGSSGATHAHTVLHVPGLAVAARWRLALAAAGGAHLVLCGTLPASATLAALPTGIVIPRRIGAAIRRLAPGFAAHDLPPGAAPGIWLAAPRAAFTALGGLAPDYDEGGDLAIADFALRAAAAGYRIDVSDAETGEAPARADAARRFMASWQPALA